MSVKFFKTILIIISSVRCFGAEVAFKPQIEDPEGKYLWSNASNWSNSELPTNQDVVQIGNDSNEVSAFLKSSGAVAHTLEISENGGDGGIHNYLTIETNGRLDVTGLISVGKDKHGFLNLTGGAITTQGAAYVGGYNRGEHSRGTVNITGGSFNVGTHLYVGSNPFGARSEGSSVTMSGGSLVVGEHFGVDSLNATNPSRINLSGNASLTLQQGKVSIQKGEFKLDGGNVSTAIPRIEFLGGSHSKLVFSGSGISSMQLDAAHFSHGTVLDVSELTLPTSTYLLLKANNLTTRGIYFSSNVDRSKWRLDINTASGEVLLNPALGDPQHDLYVVNGSGSGMYVTGKVIQITADSAAPGLVFDRWNATGAIVEDALDPSTTLQMGSGNATVTAIYKSIYPPHRLSVIDGSLSGDYGKEQVIPLSIDASVAGRKFVRWIGDAGIQDKYSSSSSYVMPDRESIVRAGYYQPEHLALNRGYHARPCGLDLNNDGEIGKDGEDNIIGRVDVENHANPRWDPEDPDGDDVKEDIWFVDSYNGNDTNDGSKGAPLKTIQEALNRCDGASDGKEDIICIYGEFNEEVTLTQGGAGDVYERDGFEFARNPMRIIGWDKDEDGQYPPFDTDDKAIIDGSNGLIMAISNGANKVSHVEIAHLVIQNFNGWHSNKARGAIEFSSSLGGSVSHIYIHDVEIKNINTGHYVNPDDPDNADEGGERIVAVFWNGETSLRHVAMSNVMVDGYGGFFARGAPANGSGKFRFKNLTLNCKSVDGFSITGFKIWGAHDGVEILDSVFDGRPQDWDYGDGGPRMIAVRPDQHDVVIRNNLFLQGRTSITVDGCSRDFGNTRTTDDILIEGNQIVVTHNHWGSGDSRPIGIRIEPGCDINRTTEDIQILNNFLFMPIRGAVALMLNPGMTDETIEQPGDLDVIGNTIYGPGNDNFLGIVINLDGVANPHRNFKICNNILANIGSSGHNIQHRYPVDITNASFTIDGNLWDEDGKFTWYGVRAQNFESWKTLSLKDAHSSVGKPIFAHLDGADLHLAPEDIVARSVGIDVTLITPEDIDGEMRAAQTPFAGADSINPDTEVLGVSDMYQTNEDVKLEVASENGVLANDGVDSAVFHGESVTAVSILVEPVSHGVIDLRRDGSFTYIPDSNYNGSDSFKYRIRSPLGKYSNPITVIIDLEGLNDVPDGREDTYIAYLGERLSIPPSGVLANDSDAEGDALSATLVQAPQHALIFDFNADGSFSYCTSVENTEDDVFYYTVTDGILTSAPIRVNLLNRPVPTEIIIDNKDAATEQTGEWLVSTAEGFYSEDSVYSDEAGATFTWNIKAPSTAVYKVYAWWTYHSSRTQYAAYTIEYDGGSETLYMGQNDSDQGGKWILLGEYPLHRDKNHKILLTQNGQQVSADAIRLVRTTNEDVAEIIVDNLNVAKTTKVGTWEVSAAEQQFWADSIYSTAPTDKFTWKPSIPVNGRYEVYIWWTYRQTRSSNVPCTVKHVNGVAEHTLDQKDQTKAGQWILLGEYEFSTAEIASIEVSGENGQASADAIKMKRVFNFEDILMQEFKIASMRISDSADESMISIATEIGGKYTLQVSQDLNSWLDVKTVIATENQTEFSHPMDEGAGKMFYRVKKH